MKFAANDKWDEDIMIKKYNDKQSRGGLLESQPKCSGPSHTPAPSSLTTLQPAQLWTLRKAVTVLQAVLPELKSHPLPLSDN